MKYDAFIGASVGYRKIEYNWRDVILYALGVGAEEEELYLVYEKELKAVLAFGTLPCFNTVNNEPQRPLPYPASEILVDHLRRETGGEVNGLHLSLEFLYHRPIDPIKGTLLYEDRIDFAPKLLKEMFGEENTVDLLRKLSREENEADREERNWITGQFWQKNKIGGLTGRKKWLIIDNKKWVFTVHLATACSFLFLLPKYHTDIFCHFRHG